MLIPLPCSITLVYYSFFFDDFQLTHLSQYLEANSMDITWHISFSGRSPAKDTIGKAFASPHALNHSQSDYDKVNAQDTAEIWSGLWFIYAFLIRSLTVPCVDGLRGVIKPGAHPRRRTFLSTVEYVLCSDLWTLLTYLISDLQLAY